MNSKSAQPSFLYSHVLTVRTVSAVCSLLIMGLIFFFSSQDGQASSRTSGFFVSLLRPFLSEDLAVVLIRKGAHFSIYTALGFCVFLFLTTFFRQNAFQSRLPFLKAGTSALIFCFLYAASDEIHQLFSDGRSGQFSDVLLDSCGALCGILLLCLILYCLIRKRSERGRSGK